MLRQRRVQAGSTVVQGGTEALFKSGRGVQPAKSKVFRELLVVNVAKQRGLAGLFIRNRRC